jgi:hypothetical protein
MSGRNVIIIGIEVTPMLFEREVQSEGDQWCAHHAVGDAADG